MSEVIPETQNPAVSEARKQSYYNLIDQLLKCPNGQEPEVLDAQIELVDEGFVNALVQAATYFAHENNPDAAKFLVHVARELARQLNLYPELLQQEA
jgi:glutamine synthetase adenylyltransferase